MVTLLVLFQSQLSVKSTQDITVLFLEQPLLGSGQNPAFGSRCQQKLPAAPGQTQAVSPVAQIGATAVWCLGEHASPPYSHFRQAGWSMKGGRPQSPRPLPRGQEGATGVKCAEAEMSCCSQADIPPVTTSTINTIVISSPPGLPLLLWEQPQSKFPLQKQTCHELL